MDEKRLAGEEFFVTVLMPAYNAEKFVAEAIYSVLGQSLQQFELLIIDDHSTDHSVEVIEAFDDPRIRLVKNEENLGISASLNKGIALAKYPFIARMDADDICHPWRFEKQLNYLREHPDCAIVSSWVRLIDEEGRYIRTEGAKEKYLYYNLFFECCIFHPTVMFRKAFLEKAGNYQIPYAEDFELFRRLSRQFEIGGIDEPLLDYRIHQSNTNTVSRKKEYDEFSLEVLRKNIKDYLGDNREVPLAYLECYRYQYDLLLQENNLVKINSCLKLLDEISMHILDEPNPNNNPANIKFMWAFKKDYIISALARRLSLFQKLKLLLRYRWNKLPYYLLSKIKNIFILY